MTINEITTEWGKDSKIDGTELAKESLKTPNIYNKYLKIYIDEKGILQIRQQNYNIMKKQRWEYYTGKSEVPCELVIMRADVPMYLDADDELQKKKIIYEYQKDKVELCERILKSLERRGFVIKNAIDFEKYMGGL